MVGVNTSWKNYSMTQITLKGCLATVAKIQDSFQNMKKYTVAGIKALNSFSFESVGMRAWKG